VGPISLPSSFNILIPQKASGPRGAQIQPKGPCPPLFGLHAGHGDKAQRAGVGVQGRLKGLMLIAVIVAFMLIQVTAAEAWTLTLRVRVDYWLRVYREIHVVCERWVKKLQEAERRKDMAEIMRAMTLLDHGHERPFKFGEL